MTYEKTNDIVISMIAYGLISPHIFEKEFWQPIREALEKQLPQKVIVYECDPLKSLRKIRKACPNCNSTLYAEKDFCPDCGQALDWD